MPAWQEQAECASGEHSDIDWFATDTQEKYDARAICMNQCPVRKECLAHALNAPELHGIWGGVDDYEIRRALSINAFGLPAVRKRPPRCPHCKSRKLQIATKKTKGKGYLTTCANEVCGISWYVASLFRPKGNAS